MKRILQLMAGAFSAAALSSGAQATTLEKLNLPGLVDRSDRVVVAEATQQKTQRMTSGLMTVTTFDVSETVIGNDAASVQVAVPGGIFEINGRRFAETWPGAPTFLVGQRAILFLDDAEEGMSSVVGFSQGMANITETENGAMVTMPGASEAVSLDKAMKMIKAIDAAPQGEVSDAPLQLGQ